MQKTKFKEEGIHYRHWPSATSTRAVMLIVHGLGEHCERYDQLASTFNANGFAVCSLDLPGHGHSDGERGHIDNFDEYEHEVLVLRNKLDGWYPNLPVYIIGHSMGGLIVARILIKHQDQFAGALLSGAAIENPNEPPAIQVLIIKALAALFPKMGILALEASEISRDSTVVDKYMNDPLVNKGKLSARFLITMFNAMDECKENASQIGLPIRIMHGGRDSMTAPNGSKQLFDSISSTDKELKIYDGLMHEIFNEPEGTDIAQEMIAWIDARV